MIDAATKELIEDFSLRTHAYFQEVVAELSGRFDRILAGCSCGAEFEPPFHTVGLGVAFKDAPDTEPDGIQLTVAFHDAKTGPERCPPGMEGTVVCADLLWTDDPWDIEGGNFSDRPVPVTRESLAAILGDLPRLVELLKRCVEDYFQGR